MNRELKKITVHYIESVPVPADSLDANPFENYNIVKTEKKLGPVSYITDNASDFVWETFSMFAKDRKEWGWMRLDNEYGDAEWTEHTVLIPVVTMTDREVQDFVEAEADRLTQEDADAHWTIRIDWETTREAHVQNILRGE